MAAESQEQQIRERAYAIWEGEGRPMNRAEAHWLQAEAEIARATRPNGAPPPPKRAAPAAKKRTGAGRPAAPARRGAQTL